MRRSRVPLLRCCLLVCGLSAARPGTAAGQAPRELALVDLAATLVGTRVAADSVEFRVDQDTTGPLQLVLRGPARRGLPQLRANFASDLLTLELVVENRSSTSFRIPLWLYTDELPTAVQRGRALSGFDSYNYVRLVTEGGFTKPEQADLYQPAPARGYPHNMRLRRIEAPSGGIDSLPPRGHSPVVPFAFTILPGVHEFRLGLALRALRAAPPVPAAAPDEVLAERLGPEYWVRSERVPGPFVRGLLTLRFRSTTSTAIRQLLVDRIGGRVIGGHGDASAGAVERDYLVEVADTTASGERTLTALALVRSGRSFHLPRAGVVLADTAGRAGAQRGQPAAPSDTAATPDTARWNTAATLSQQTRNLRIAFAPDASVAERQAALELVGATVLGREPFDAFVATVSDSSAQSYQRAAARLWPLPIVHDAEARVGSFELTELCAGWCYRGQLKDSGRAAKDPRVRSFARSLQFPALLAIQDVLWLPAFDFLVFKAYYGQSSDNYPSVLGLRHRGRVGLVGVFRDDDTTRTRAAFPYSPRDTTLASKALLDTLERGASSFYAYTYLETIIRSPVVTPALLARIIPRCYAQDVGCDIPALVKAGVRIRDVGALTALSFMRPWRPAPVTEKVLVARQGLRRIAPVVLADRAAPPAALFALALASNDEPADSVLARRLLAHPGVTADLATLTVLADKRPWVAERVIERVPAAARPTLAAVFRWPAWPPDRSVEERLYALLADPQLGRDQAVLTVVANLRPEMAPAAVADAARRLPDTVFRRSDWYLEPPPVRRAVR